MSSSLPKVKKPSTKPSGTKAKAATPTPTQSKKTVALAAGKNPTATHAVALAGKKLKKGTGKKKGAGKKKAPATAGLPPISPTPAAPAAAEPAAAAEPEPAPVPAAPLVKGMIKVRYNHYIEEVEVEHPEGGTGAVVAATVSDQLCLEFAYHGAFKLHLNPNKAGGLETRLSLGEDGTVAGVQIGQEYWTDVEEDVEAEKAVVRKTYEGTGGGEGSMPIATSADDGEERSGCSCLYGNPCMEAYNCKNWQNRFEVAKANGWKGYS